MKLTFLGQGFESSSVNAIGNYLIQYFGQTNFHSFTGISAFASKAGIFGLSEHIRSAKEKFEHLTLIVGIDQEGTSKEALEEILDLNINSYIFYQSEAPIFHPKIYLFEGHQNVKLLIGSSNLTVRGLFTNVESSLLVEFDVDDEEGIELLRALKSYYQTLFDFSDPNLFKIDNQIISDFMSKGILPDEATRNRIYSKKSNNSDSFASQRINIPTRATARIPKSFFPSSKIRRQIENGTLTRPSINPSTDVLLWESGPLTERDLNIPKGPKTNPTGSMLFKKGKLKSIDQRHYFRDAVFSSLPWVNDEESATSHLERATAFFHIIIEDVNHGVFPLILTHNTKTDTASYYQKNSMTSVSWGQAKDIIAKENLIGKSVRLYKSANESSNYYTLIIV